MQFNQIYINGCSFVWGVGHSDPNIFPYFEETNGIDTSHGTHWNGKTLFNNYDWVRQRYNIGGRLSEKLDVNVIDESIYGGSLQRVVRKTHNWIYNNIEKVKDTLFILEWPIGVRKEIYVPIQKRYVNYTSNFDNFDGIDPYLHRVLINEIEPNFFSEGIVYLEDLQSIIGLITLIQSLNSKVLILLDEVPFQNFTEETIKYISQYKIKNILNQIVMPNVINFEKNGKTTKSMIEYFNKFEEATISKDTNQNIKDDHNSLRGSNLISEQIIKHINKMYGI